MKLKPALLIGGLIYFGACGTDASRSTLKIPSEHGRWAVDEASRNGKKTNTLDAAFFEFDTSAQLIETNFTGEPLKLQYTYEEGVINLKGSALLDSFIVNEATDSTLQLTTIIRGTPFVFKLKPDEVQKGGARRESQESLLDHEK